MTGKWEEEGENGEEEEEEEKEKEHKRRLLEEGREKGLGRSYVPLSSRRSRRKCLKHSL